MFHDGWFQGFSIHDIFSRSSLLSEKQKIFKTSNFSHKKSFSFMVIKNWTVIYSSVNLKTLICLIGVKGCLLFNGLARIIIETLKNAHKLNENTSRCLFKVGKGIHIRQVSPSTTILRKNTTHKAFMGPFLHIDNYAITTIQLLSNKTTIYIGHTVLTTLINSPSLEVIEQPKDSDFLLNSLKKTQNLVSSGIHQTDDYIDYWEKEKFHSDRKSSSLGTASQNFFFK